MRLRHNESNKLGPSFSGFQVETTSPLGMSLVLIPLANIAWELPRKRPLDLLMRRVVPKLPEWYIEAIVEEVPARTEEVVLPLLVSKYETPAAIYNQVISIASSSSASSSASSNSSSKPRTPMPRQKGPKLIPDRLVP